MKDKVTHVVKGFGIFAGIYFLAAVIVEIILIAGLSAMGYDAMHGQMPDSFWTGLFPLYGFAVFALLSILFHCVLRRKKTADMQMRFGKKTVAELLAGLAAGALLVGIAVGFLTVIGAYRFDGFCAIRPGIMAATFGAYLVQGFSEELLCRGLLQNYLEEKLSRIPAILFTAVLFIAPHAATILECEPVVMILSFLNLLLVSVLFSLSMIRFQSLWVPAGIHIGWNFVLSYICGLELTGAEAMDGVLRFLVNPSMVWLHGGMYGMEAGFVVTVILLVCDAFLYKTVKE